MSRVDDDRDAQRVQERLVLKQRQEAELTKTRVASDSAFARKMTETRLAQDAQAHHLGDETTLEKQAQDSVTREALVEDGFAETDALKRNEDGRGRAAEGKKGFAKRLATEQQKGGALGRGRADAGKLSADRTVQEASKSRGDKDESRDSHAQEDHSHLGGKEAFRGKQSSAAASSSAATEGDQRLRQGDGARAGASLAERKEALRKSGVSTSAIDSASAGPSEDGSVDADAQGGGHGGDGDDKGAGSKQFAGQFRFNPALAPPVPVIKPKDTGASERLRALANEIAQKIVERVRVGRNADGLAEFQIDLKSSVLSGLTIRLSGSHGRIRAFFSGRDREVLKLLRENSDGLRAALEGRGLRLEELKIEAVG